MPGRRHKTEEIINKLRQAEVELGRGKSMAVSYRPSSRTFLPFIHRTNSGCS
jgi:hypothetical protein